MEHKYWSIGYLAGFVVIVVVACMSFPVNAHDPEAEVTELQWRSEGTLPATWEGTYHRTTIPQGETFRDAIPITHVGDGSVRVAYVSGPPACVWEAPSLAHKVGGGRTLAEVGNEAWLKGGFGGVVYAVAGRTCEGFDIDLCDTVWC